MSLRLSIPATASTKSWTVPSADRIGSHARRGASGGCETHRTRAGAATTGGGPGELENE